MNMHYFDRKIWTRMESPVFAVRMLAALRWQHSAQRYSKALMMMRRSAPEQLEQASRIPLGDSIILGVNQSADTVCVELHSSTRTGLSGRAQLIFHEARLVNRAPRGSWIVQEEWAQSAAADVVAARDDSSSASLDSGAGRNQNRYRFTALCTRGWLCVECSDASLNIHDQIPQSEVQLRSPFAGSATPVSATNALTQTL